ncbi:MAG: SDR family oxidoreductase [Fimbriimonadaceae bacterium]|nr:SDR family oxidoreductase [Fimbriimonadaceae bacterium]
MEQARLDSRVLVLGATGMLGHKVVQTLSPCFEAWATCRKPYSALVSYDIFDQERLITGLDAASLDDVDRVIEDVQPQFVINCIGIVKQHQLANDAVACLTVNSLLPHRAAKACERVGGKFIHISTDCVFDGKGGNYSESDVPTAEDLYGRSKWMGEVTEGTALTLRTSIIGPELDGCSGLLEWFLSEHKEVKGYTNALFSGLTTVELARVIARLITERPDLKGLYQVAGPAISKYDLLHLIKEAFGLKTIITPDSQVQIDRTLNGEKFVAGAGYSAPSWREMIQEITAHMKLKEREHYVLAG